eukprot:gb/GEZN01024938.1/.p1 GENE.gb/GEZN01024938.1/~~gb/GEZN01024938.1/.p1  ORF type:complete len:137 (-),score=26.41 gb/GEZN01024938.1/:97-507(-)
MEDDDWPLVSIIIPVFNSEKWLSETFGSILEQTYKGALEISIFDDGSTDGSMNVITRWRNLFEAKGIRVVVGFNTQVIKKPSPLSHPSSYSSLFFSFLPPEEKAHVHTGQDLICTPCEAKFSSLERFDTHLQGKKT